jgi:gamma-glutamyltranspeptidase/glutathione hydrolase
MNRVLIIFLFALATAGCSGKRGVNVSGIKSGKGIVADSGMVVSAHLMASVAGVQVLRSGGNAVDAAVATGFALAVCYPEAGNIGGGGFMLIRLSDGKTDLIDFREKASLLAAHDMYLDQHGAVIKGMSTETIFASGVPGSVDGLLMAHNKYGRMSLRDVMQPAVNLAENGFIITEEQASDLNRNRKIFIDRNPSGSAFVRDSLWHAGDTLVQKDLAATLKLIRDNGRDGFYAGKTARLIIKKMKEMHGIISDEDLKHYQSISRTPIETSYRGYRVITAPPPSGGGITLIQLLEMVEPFPIREWGYHSAKTIHLVTEAERRAFADRSEYPGDPDFVDVPVNELINRDYLKRRMSSFNMDKATLSAEIKPGSPVRHESTETTHYSVVDIDGDAVAVTTTLNGSFGNSIVVDSAGFLLNNEMDDFSIKPGFPNMYGLVGGEANSVQPGKRMLSSMTPTIVEKNGKLFMVVGSPGGSTIPTTVFQVIVNVIDYGMDIQDAVDAGRFHHQWLPDWISYEKESIDSLAAVRLRSMGHKLNMVRSIGRANAIRVLDDGRKEGGADTRGDNSACGY